MSASTDRSGLADRLTTALAQACPGSHASIRGSLASDSADEFSDIDLLWSVPATRFGEALGSASAAIASVAPLLSFRVDRDEQQSSTRRLVFARLIGAPIWWRIDLDVRAVPEDDVDGQSLDVLEWDPYESALQNALATIKAVRRGHQSDADGLLRRGFERIGRPQPLAEVREQIIELAATIAGERPHLREFADAVIAEAGRLP